MIVGKLNKKVVRKLKSFRSESIHNRTPAEIWAEDEICKRFSKADYQVEFIFFNYRLDFYFPMVKVAIEIDGGYHNNPKQVRKDVERDAFLAERNIKTFRVVNFDSMKLLMVLDYVDLVLKEKKSVRAEKVARKLNKHGKRRNKAKIRQRARATNRAAVARMLEAKNALKENKPVFIRRSKADIKVHESLKFKSQADIKKYMDEQMLKALVK